MDQKTLEKDYQTEFTSIALGDGENDINVSMLTLRY